MLKIFKKYFLILSLVVLAVSTAGIHLTKAVIFFPTSNVAGIVTDSSTGQPLANASVRLHGGFFDTTVTTGSNGLYDIFVDFCGNNLTLEVTLTGYETYQAPLFVPCYQTVTHNIALNPETSTVREPVLIIPGIPGSELFHNGEEIWMNTNKMTISIDGSFINDTFLLVLEMDENGNSIEDIEVGDIIREKLVVDIWINFIQDLINAGYTENTDLFVFPYDWRQGNADSAALLADKIDEILTQTGADKVDIVAHSMGGLVTKQYILSHGEDKIDQIIFMGTPHYGAPKSLKILLFGDRFGVPFILDPNTIGDISQNMPAVYELLPSLPYFSEYNAYVLDMTDVDGNGAVGALNSDETDELIGNLGLNTSLRDAAMTYHSMVDGWAPSPGLQSRIHNILGCANGTIGRLVAGTGKDNDIKWQVWLVDGDETVPLKSAQGVVNGREYYLPEAKHSRLPDSTLARQLVLDILEDNDPNLSDAEYSDIQAGIANCGFSGYLQSVHSPVTLQAYDSSGNHTGRNVDNGIDIQIPGSDYFEMGDDKFLYIPTGIEVDFVYKGLADGEWQLAIQEVSEAGISKAAHFLELPVNPDLRAKMNFPAVPDLANLNLKIDNNGDGTIDATKMPDSVLTGLVASDVTPPTIEILSPEQNKSYLNSSTLEIDFNVNDDESGVASSNAKLDGQTVIDTEIIDLSLIGLGQHELKVAAEDNTGNIAESMVLFETHTTLESLKDNLEHYWQKGLITRFGTYMKLKAKLVGLTGIFETKSKLKAKADNAPWYLKHAFNKGLNGLNKTISKQFNQFIKEVKKAKGKTIDEPVADLLIEQVEYLQDNLKRQNYNFISSHGREQK